MDVRSNPVCGRCYVGECNGHCESSLERAGKVAKKYAPRNTAASTCHPA
jgi:hypothetical protein